MIIVNFMQEPDLEERGTDLALLEIMEPIINTGKAVGHKFDWARFECIVCQSRREDLYRSRRKLVLFHVERKLSRRFNILRISITSVPAVPRMMIRTNLSKEEKCDHTSDLHVWPATLVVGHDADFSATISHSSCDLIRSVSL